MKLVATLITALLMSGAHAATLKDCRLHVMKAAPNAAKTALEYSEAENKKLKIKKAGITISDVDKSTCLGKMKNSACGELKDRCAAPTETPLGAAGMVGGWVQWGDSKEECSVCPGFSHW